MLLIGLAFLVDWLIANVFMTLSLDSLAKATLITAIIFIVLGLLVEVAPDSLSSRLRRP